LRKYAVIAQENGHFARSKSECSVPTVDSEVLNVAYQGPICRRRQKRAVKRKAEQTGRETREI
jgi:hypothetical protein